MPISGKFYISQELQQILEVTKGRVSNLEREQGWTPLKPGLYCAEDVEPYLLSRGIDPARLPVRDYDHPEGATREEREKGTDDIYAEL